MMSEDNCKIHDECGVIACVASTSWPTELDVANIISVGLIGLQHRGQESAGIVMSTGKVEDSLQIHKGMGLVSSVFNSHILSTLKGNLGIGHTRYSTHGTSDLSNCQPFVVDTKYGKIATAHNGELVNKGLLRKQMLNRGVGLSTGSDSELITQLLCLPIDNEEKDTGDWPGRLQNLMSCTPSAYSLVLMHGDCVYAARDPYGNRPLCIGRLYSHSTENCDVSEDDSYSNTEGWLVTSESCVFQSLGAELLREVHPGEIIRVDRHGITSVTIVSRPANGQQYPAFCVFEYVYFARSDSVFEGQMVYSVRRRCGMQLAKEAPVEADIVSTVPESATPAAFGYALKAGIPYDEVLAKNRYIGRTFIQPSTRLRKLAVAKKFGVLRENVTGKRVVIVDDSIVRGNTMCSIVRMLREGGAKEVHVRLASPPVRHPCYMGINIPTREELLANRMTVEETAKFLDADSVAYLSVEGLLRSINIGIHNEKFSQSSDLPVCEFNEYGKNKNVSNFQAEETLDKSINTYDNSHNRGVVRYNDDESNNKKVGHCVACLTGDYPVHLDW